MKIHTIDYKKHRDQEGTVYNQTITTDAELMAEFNERLQLKYDHINEKKESGQTLDNWDLELLTYTQKLKKGVNFIKLTELYYFCKFCQGHAIGSPRKVFNFRNTIINVL